MLGDPGSRCGDTDSCSPSPMNFWTSSEPDTLMKVQSVWWATALASSVFPVPGGPYNSTPCTHYRGLHQYFPVVSAGKNSCRFPAGSLAPCHSPKTCMWHGLLLSLGASVIGCLSLCVIRCQLLQVSALWRLESSPQWVLKMDGWVNIKKKGNLCLKLQQIQPPLVQINNPLVHLR